jgi:uncharacterized membrane protein
MDALSESIARLLRHQEETGKRLARIEAALGIVHEPAAAAPANDPLAEPRPPASDSQPESPASLENRIGLAWINRIGVVTLILGAGFFFKLAAENQWIGEAARAGLGALCGLLAIVAADHLWRRGQTVFAQGITASGIAILYLAVYAAFGLYRILPAYFAFVLMAITTAGAGALALRYSAAPIAGLGLFGGYATPLLLGTGAELPWFYLSYVLLLDIAAVEVARRRGWRLLVLLALSATVVLFGTWLGQPVERKWLATLFTLLFYALFASVRSRLAALTAQALAPLTLTAIWPRQFSEFVSPLMLLAVGGLAVANWRGWPAGAFVTGLFAWIAEVLWYGGEARPLWPLVAQETLLFGLLAAWTPWRVRRREKHAGRFEALLPVVNAAFYFGAVYAQLRPLYQAWMGLFAVALACAHMAMARAVWAARTAALMLAGIAWVLLLLAAPIQFSGFRITILWALEGAALAWISVRLMEPRAGWAAIAVFVGVLARLAFSDARSVEVPALSPMWTNPRFLTFLVSAGSMFASARWMRMMHRRALAVYVSAHAVLLWGLLLEIAGWAMRTARPEEFASFSSAAASISMAAYAVALAGWGIYRRSALDRLLGLGLIAIVVAKLYLYDVWLLGRVYRVVAFAMLGALLLAMSYLYSRYRPAIETWWRAGDPHV